MYDLMLGWTETDVQMKGGALADASTNQPVSDEAAKLNSWFGFDTPVYLCPSISCSACASGIVINLDQIERQCQEEALVDPMAVVAYVLAHEKCHHAQARNSSWAAIRAAPIRNEIQADFVAGVWIGANILIRDFNFLAVASSAFAVGNPNWPNGNHPAPEQRRAAVNRGVASAAAIVHLQLTGGGLADSKPIYQAVNIGELLRDSWQIAGEIESGKL